MDDALVRQFMRELRIQGDFTDMAYRQILDAIGEHEKFVSPHVALGCEPDPDDWGRHKESVFFAVHAFLSHVANVSKILDPGHPQSPVQRQEVEQRAARLLSELGITTDRPSNLREARDHFEHYDERLHAWTTKVKGKGTLKRTKDMVIAPRQRIWAITEDIHRTLDIETEPGRILFRFENKVYDLTAMWQFVSEVRIAAAQWLRAKAPRLEI